MKVFKHYQHCGDDYLVALNSATTPVCEECGEEAEFVDVELYEDRVRDEKPVDRFESVEDYRKQK